MGDVVVDDLVIPADEVEIGGEFAVKSFLGLREEFVPDTQRQYDETPAGGAFPDEAHQFELDRGFMEPEGREDCATAAGERPLHDGAAMWGEIRIDFSVVDNEPGCLGDLHFRTEEFDILIHGECSRADRRRAPVRSAEPRSVGWKA